MDLDCYTKGAVKISMIKYLQKVEDKFPIEITGTAKSPACEHLFQVRDDDDPRKNYLYATRAMKLHRVTGSVNDRFYIIRRGNNPTSPVLTVDHAKSRLTRANS